MNEHRNVLLHRYSVIIFKEWLESDLTESKIVPELSTNTE